jgi:hypothetical protein
MATTNEVLQLGPGSEARFGLAFSEDSYLRTVKFHDSIQNANQLWAQGNATLASYGVFSYGQPPLTNITLKQLPGGGAIEIQERTWRGNYAPRWSWEPKYSTEKWFFESDATTPTGENVPRDQPVLLRLLKIHRYNYATYLSAVGSWDGLEGKTNDTAYTVFDRTYQANSLLFLDTRGRHISWGAVYNKYSADIRLLHNPNTWRESYINTLTNIAAWKDRFQRTTFPIL